MESLRLAPSVTQPIGIPNRSVAIDHFHPIFPLSVGLGPVPSPPQGALCRLPSTATSDRSRGDDLVVAGDRFFDEFVEDAGLEPLGAPVAQGGLPCGGQSGGDVPGAAGDQPDQDPLEAVPVGDPGSVAAQWVVVRRSWW
jgi:hypothetical protein